MSETVLVALITGGLSAFVSVVATMVTNSKTTALMEYRLNQLEKKQDKHNHLIERMTSAEADIKVMDEKIAVANHRIADLEVSEHERVWDTTVKARDI